MSQQIDSVFGLLESKCPNLNNQILNAATTVRFRGDPPKCEQDAIITTVNQLSKRCLEGLNEWVRNPVGIYNVTRECVETAKGSEKLHPQCNEALRNYERQLYLNACDQEANPGLVSLVFSKIIKPAAKITLGVGAFILVVGAAAIMYEHCYPKQKKDEQGDGIKKRINHK